VSRLFIGTSGWNYDHWKAQLYAGVKRKDWLHHYAQQFNAVEVNATFYRLQNRQTFEHWYDQTPPDFHFSIKGNRFLTHNKKFNDPFESIALERERALGLGEKLAVVVWQLPRTFLKNVDRLHTFAEALNQWGDTRHAIEFRHSSWFDDEVAYCLNEHNVANCQSDASGWPIWDAVTTDLVYVRLHGHTRTYISAYSTSTLTKCASEIRKWLKAERTVHVYFDNDAAGAAPKDAKRLAKIVADL
jgi:uncharacterized protein YecE (DUF72 family)